MSSSKPYPVTPDGRYFVVRGRLWRRMAANTPYAEWYAALATGPEGRPGALR